MLQKIILALLFISISYGMSFSKQATIKNPQFIQSGNSKMWCPVCGMNLKKFYKTSHAATLKDGTIHQYCSIRCLAVDMQDHEIDLNKVQVVDIPTQKLILAKDAFYLV